MRYFQILELRVEILLKYFYVFVIYTENYTYIFICVSLSLEEILPIAPGTLTATGSAVVPPEPVTFLLSRPAP